jgi:FkbM family methyltransferase
MPFGVYHTQDILRFNKNHPINTIFDVGANIGATSIEYAEVFKDADIYSFEPVKSTYNILKSSTHSEKRINTYNCALGKEETRVTIHLRSNNELNSINPQRNVAWESDIGKEEIDVNTVDNFCSTNNINEIDILKIDTEGFELNVLSGASNMLSRNKIKYIYAETTIRDNDTTHTNFFDLHNFLRQKKYSFLGFYNSERRIIDNQLQLLVTNALYCSE